MPVIRLSRPEIIRVRAAPAALPGVGPGTRRRTGNLKSHVQPRPRPPPSPGGYTVGAGPQAETRSTVTPLGRPGRRVRLTQLA